jgi:hypothetical protein
VEPEAQDVPAELPAVTGRAAEQSLRAARVREAAREEIKVSANLNKAVPEPEETAVMEEFFLLHLTIKNLAVEVVAEAQAKYIKEPTETAQQEEMAIKKAAWQEKCLCCLTAIA